MFVDLPDGCWYGDQNTWNIIPISGQKIALSKWITEYWIIKQSEPNKTEQNRMRVEQYWQAITKNWQQIQINTDSQNIHNWRLNCDHPMFARVKYICDYGTDNCNPISLNICCEASDDMLSVSLFFHQSCGLLKNHRTPRSFVASNQTLHCGTRQVP